MRCGLKVNKLRLHERLSNTIGTFECDCGTRKPLQICKVISGRIKSCGCLQRKRNAIMILQTVKLEKHLKETNYDWKTFKLKNP